MYAQADELTHKLPDFLFGFLYVWGKEKTGPSFVRWQNLRNMREIQYELCDFPTPQIRDARWPEIFWRFFTQIGSRAMPRLAWFRFYRGRGQQKPINFLMSIMDDHEIRPYPFSILYFSRWKTKTKIPKDGIIRLYRQASAMIYLLICIYTDLHKCGWRLN